MNAQPENAPVGILIGSEIEAQLDELMIGGDTQFVESCSYDMRVGTIFCGGDRISASSPHPQKNVQIQPGEFIYMYTLESITLPENISATAYAINRLSSRGLLVLNPGHVDPGFRGPLTVTALNLNNTPLTVEAGDKIITILFTRLSRAAKPYPRNEPREEREKAFTKHVDTNASKGIGALIQHNIRSPIATKEDLKRLKKKIEGSHTNKLTWFIAILSLVLAVFAVVVSIVPTMVSLTQQMESTSSSSSPVSNPQ